MVQGPASAHVLLLTAASVLRVVQSAGDGPAPNPLVAYVVPHSHDDPGWLKTSDDYYTQNVEAILTSVTQALLKNPNRTFTQVEIVYFSRWWAAQTNATQASVRQLVAEQRLDFSLGGWVMGDEGTTLEASDIDQMTEGMLWLRRELGYTPTAGWHIDPFGHAQTTPSMLARMGLSAFGLNRLDWRKKFELMNARELEFVWRSDRSLGVEADMFIHVLPFHYSTPPIHPWADGDLVANGEAFVDMLRARSALYIHDHVMVPFGDDFNFQVADEQFGWMDELIAYVNGNASLRCTVQYAHFQDYARAVSALNLSWPVKTERDDFMLYTDHEHSYWSGYYSSHPHLKGQARGTARTLRQAEVMLTVALRRGAAHFPNRPAELQQAREAAALMQHHDAMTGTAVAAVVADYATQLANASRTAEVALARAAAAAIGVTPGGLAAAMLPTASAALARGASVAVVVANDLGWLRSAFVPLGTNRTDLIVLDAAGARLPSQITAEPPWAAAAAGDALPGGPWTHRLYFLAEDLPPVGTRTYFLRVDGAHAAVARVEPQLAGAGTTLSSRRYTAVFANGLLSALWNNASGAAARVAQDLHEYVPAWQSGQPSGAYVFRPEADHRLAISLSGDSGTAEWEFEAPMSAASPVVLLTPGLVAERYPWAPHLWRDSSSFVATTAAFNRSAGFGVRVARVQEGQTDYMAVSWLVLDAAAEVGAQFCRGFQAGSAEVEAGALGTWLHFPQPFTASLSWPADGQTRVGSSPPQAQMPRVIATARLLAGPPVDVLVYVRAVSHAGASVSLAVIGGGKLPPGTKVAVDWLAWPATLEPSLPAGPAHAVAGQITVLATGGSVQLLEVSVPAPDGGSAFDVADPAVLASARLVGTDDTSRGAGLAVTVVDRSSARFTVLVACIVDGCTLPRGGTVELAWVAFRRRPWRARPVRAGGGPSMAVVRGPCVSEVRQRFADGYAQTFRVFHPPPAATGVDDPAGIELDRLELVHYLGTIAPNRELTSVYRTGLRTATGPTRGLFFADENGRHLVEREYNLHKEEPVAGNMWPMVQRAFVRDQRPGLVQLTLLGERAHAAGSHADGELEVLLQRRTTVEDGFGTGEVLDETQPVAPTFWLSLELGTDASAVHRRGAALLESPPRALFGVPGDGWHSASAWTQAVGAALPANVHLLTLTTRPLPTFDGRNASVLLRLQHLFEADEGPLAQPVAVDLAAFLAPLGLLAGKRFVETSLSANQPLAEMHRLPFRGATGALATRPAIGGTDGTVVHLHAGEARTFVV
jgi:hypothetical protein